MAQKKLPGKGWEYLVYNTLDQVVATQDSLQREQNQWVFTKYDALGRVIMTGLYDDDLKDTTQAGLQTTIDRFSVLWETPLISGRYQYTSNAWPTAPDEMLTVNYYDNYNTENIRRIRNKPPVNATQMPTGLLTATLTEVLEVGDMLTSIFYYDDLGRNIETYKQSAQGGAARPNDYDAITSTYDFTNAVTGTVRQHSYNNGASALTVNNNYTYDHMGRKLQTREQINTDSTTGTPVLLCQNDYNELGQLLAKQLHSTDSVNFLQDIAYNYNERGWLLQSQAPLFSEKLQYNDTNRVRGISPAAQYNGNIASQTWAQDQIGSNSFIYSYDRLNRLTSGITADGAYAERGISYDMAGNINNLSRVYGTTLIDSLQYRYNGNQLQSIRDVSPDISKNGYPSGNGNYFYDGNGNMNRVLTKEGTGSYTTSYNILNLPDTVTLPHGNIVYTYDAAGEKLNKTVKQDSTTTTTDYISGIQYTNGKLAFIQTEEGRALPDSLGNYNYEYTLADHLGNSRVSFATVKDTAVVIQQDDYMPFGMEIAVRYAANPKNEYLYNKKELQLETGLYDYGARFYDPVIERWTTVDPLAEKARRLTPYGYGDDNSIRNIDPDGMETEGCCKVYFITSADTKRFYNWVANELGFPTIEETDKVVTGQASATEKSRFEGKAINAAVTILSIGGEGEGGEGGGGGKYSGLKEPKTVGDGLKTTSAQRGRILEANEKANGGKLKSDISGKELDRPTQSKKGEKSNMNQAEVDHIKERSKGGSNSNENLRVISKKENIERNKQ